MIRGANQLGGGDCNTLASSLVLSAKVQLRTWVTTKVKGTLKHQLILEVQLCTRVMAEPGHDS